MPKSHFVLTAMGMDRTTLLRCLEEARHRANDEEMLIEAQKRIVATLTATGTDAREALNTLDALEQSHDLRLGEIDRLLEALDKLPADGKT